jgi:hypothetical protein
MSTQSFNLTTPLKFDSRERVAYDLMQIIAHFEATPSEADAREYYLTLYRQCLAINSTSNSIESVLAMQHMEK